jgi:hypothetical protein
VSPSFASLDTMQIRQFTATVTGTTNTAVLWSASCGAISSSGFYTAPPIQTSCAVTATSRADSSKFASATVDISAPQCAGNFVWLKFYAPEAGTASGKAVTVTMDDRIVVGVDSIPANGLNPVATLAFYAAEGTQGSVWSNDVSSSIAAMTYDLDSDVVATVGYAGDNTNLNARAGMLLLASASPPKILMNKTFQLEGMRTEIRAVSIRGSEVYLAVNSDFENCGVVQGSCSGDWVVVTDRQGSILRKFSVGSNDDNPFGPASITGLALVEDSLFVTGNLSRDGPNRYSYLGKWTIDGQSQLASADIREFGNAVPVIDGLGNLYTAGTRRIPGGLFRPEQNRIEVFKRDLDMLSITHLFEWDAYSTGTFNYTKGATGLNPGGLMVVGSLSKQENSDAGVVSLDPAFNVLWQKRFDALPSGTASSWNSGAYDSDGKVLLVGTGSDGRDDCGLNYCPLAVVGRFCVPTPP